MPTRDPRKKSAIRIRNIHNSNFSIHNSLGFSPYPHSGCVPTCPNKYPFHECFIQRVWTGGPALTPSSASILRPTMTSSSSSPSRNQVILLVDDDPNDRFLVRRAFEKLGIENPLIEVSDGAEAIAY